jgi:RimJ/RimL family protein N-acetyltransferase
MAGVVLGAVELSDVPWIFDACQDPQIQRWTTVPRPYLIEHAESFCNGEGVTERIRWTIRDVAVNARGLGLISVHVITDGVAEIGYWVAPWARGEGVCTGAVGHVVDYLSGLEAASAVTAKVASTNIASQRVMIKSGFEAVGDTSEPLPDGELKVPGIVFRREI